MNKVPTEQNAFRLLAAIYVIGHIWDSAERFMEYIFDVKENFAQV